MITSIISKDAKGFEWIHVLSPDPAEIQQLVAQYNLQPESVEDALQPGHLPKFERLKNYVFVILRMYSVERESEADTVRELTNKVAIFISSEYILTIQMYQWPDFEKIKDDPHVQEDYMTPFEVLNEICKVGLQSFDEPADKLNRAIDYFEEHIFIKQRKVPLLKSLYYLKRKVDVIRRILVLTHDIVDHIDPPESTDAYTRDIRDLYIKQQSIFDSLAENTNHLLAIYFNISSQRTNEIIRVLTIFSVFFMPLTFIAGVYGMNFDVMPELRYKWGYAGVLIFMLLVVTAIYIWFKRKNWL